jgi:hypothetical protein
MDQIFVFGTATWKDHFTNRESETGRLCTNFRKGINTILISPRRWGKTSLVRRASEIINSKKEKIIVVNIDAFICRSEEDFLRAFSTEILKQSYSKWEEWVEKAMKFLSRISPKFSIGTDPYNDFTISIDYLSSNESVPDILNLPQKIAEEKKCRIVVCIDEFQQVAEFQEALTFQKKLRSAWQLQDKVTYCLYGSKMHILTSLFSKQSMPFYKFGDVMFLQKIAEAHWVTYICSRFKESGKTISEALAADICRTVENHSSYVQHLAWLVWTKTQKTVTEKDLTEATQDLINQNAMLFYNITENLTGYHLNFLRALLDGVETKFTRSEVMKKYNLGTSANVTRIKKSLEKKEIIDISAKRVTLIDPVFKLWIKKEMNL